MKRKGFTLIEIVSSLLIFAAGGTMALSVFNYNAGNRVEIMERMEASDLASSILNTQILCSQTDSKWKDDYDSIRDAATMWTPFKDIHIQSLEADSQAEEVRRNAQTLDGAANFLKSDYNAFTQLSGYQWRFRLIPVEDREPMKLKRSNILYRKYSAPAFEQVLDDPYFMLQVEVSWPRDAITDEEADEHKDSNGQADPLPRQRKKVVLNTVVSCPD